MKAVYEAWGYPIMRYLPDWVTKASIEHMPQELLEFYPEQLLLKRIETINHSISLIAEADKHELDWIDRDKYFTRRKASKFLMDAYRDKENAGKFTRAWAMYGTQAMADEVWLTLEEYREQIIQACNLDCDDPIQERKNIFKKLETIRSHLNQLQIEKVHMVGEDCDLRVQLGDNRNRMAWSGRNIPSYEVFASPDRRGTQGWMRFDQPLYRYWSLIKDVYLRFEDGLIVEATAWENEQLLKEMIAQPNANKIWEYSLTDSRISRITKFMGETLYDENRGGEFWNSHIAVGMAYKDAFPWDSSAVSEEQREEMWYNDSVIHTDIVSTTNRTVDAYCKDWSIQRIYENWMFTFLDNDEE